MQLVLLDWLIILGSLAISVAIGLLYARRASKSVEEYYLSGRKLTWWLSGTSIVATTFSADTPLVVSGWVRDYGIWKNWLWWCFAAGGMLTAFLFARWWRRAGVMTTAELAEARYGDREAKVLRGFLGFYQAGVINVIVLCWVLLAAAKIGSVIFGVNHATAIAVACASTLAYSLTSGLWGAVVTDFVQFALAMAGSIALAVLAWNGAGGIEALRSAVDGGTIAPEVLALVPPAGPGSIFDASFWTVSIAAFAVYLGVSWWATDSVDGGTYVVQRIAACKDDRHGILAQLWYNVAHHALRPWPWILVALASLVVLPNTNSLAPVAGTVARVDAAAGTIEIAPERGGAPVAVTYDPAAELGAVVATQVGARVAAGAVLVRSDSERAYPAMMRRYLPPGLLGLVVASLLAALMSTISTHVVLASSFFVNDLYRRFLVKDRGAGHYIAAGRVASVVVLALAGWLATIADSIADLFTFFLAFLGGVGPVYVLRWLWWRVRAVTEIAAMLASSAATVYLTFVEPHWNLGPLAPGGALAPEGRLCLVAAFALSCSILVTLAARRPDPARLVEFYRRVRPFGAWGPVAALAPDVRRPRGEVGTALLGVVGSLAAIFGVLFGFGTLLIGVGPPLALAAAVAVAGIAAAVFAVRRLS